MPDVVIIGAGIGGLTCAIGLKRQLGLQDFVIYERASDVGGTWRGNVYPGAASDTQIHFYSLSTDLNPDWPCVQGTQPIIQAYWRRLSEKYDLYPHISFNTLVVSAEWNAEDQRYHIVTRDMKGVESSTTAKIIITAIGILDVPRFPDIPGLSSFKGELFHSAQWKTDVDLRNKRVAVVGNGASATQFVPIIAEDRTTLITQFCRTPNWFIPPAQAPYGAAWRWMLRNVPGLLWLHRMRIFLMFEILYFCIFSSHSPLRPLIKKYLISILRSKAPKEELPNLIPDFKPGCKRLLFDTAYLTALNQNNLSLNWDGIQSICEDGIITKKGEKIELDVIIFATGFIADHFPISIRGSEGKTIQEYYDSQGYPKAYKGTTVPGFPNLFMIAGPNTTTGHTSVLHFEEFQVDYIIKFVKPLLAGIVSTFEVTSAATDRYNEWIHARLARSVHTSCISWYRTGGGEGKITSIFPGPGTMFWWCLRAPKWSDYKVTAVGTEWKRRVRREKLRRWLGNAKYLALLTMVILALKNRLCE